MFRRFRENEYRKKVRKTVSRVSGILERNIPLAGMPKNDTEFENMVNSTDKWTKLINGTNDKNS